MKTRSYATAMLLLLILATACKKNWDNPNDINSNINPAEWAPANLKITPLSAHSVTLEWKGSSGTKDGYLIDRKVNNSPWQTSFAVIPGETNHYTDDNVDIRINAYTYRVYAFSGDSKSAYATDTIAWPVIETKAPFAVYSDAAKSGGKITFLGEYTLISKGLCWSTNENPTVYDFKTGETSGAVDYTISITGLSPLSGYYARAFICLSFDTIYGNQVDFHTTPPLGALHAGGIVFYLDGTGGGLVCATANQSDDCAWGCKGVLVEGTSFSVGSGSANTDKITSRCRQTGIAARLCADLSLSGFNDWYLPSVEEFSLMFQNIIKNGAGNFSGEMYWSSTEVSANDAYVIDLIPGILVGGYHSYDKDAADACVRAIRRFEPEK